MSENKSKFAIVNKIAALLQLGEFGKIENFIQKVDRTLTKEINTLKKNKENAKFNSENRLAEYKDQLEDANQDLANAYLNIDPERVNTNERAKSYIDEYLSNIKRCQEAITTIEDNIKDEKVALKDLIKTSDEGIASRQASIDSIVK